MTRPQSCLLVALVAVAAGIGGYLAHAWWSAGTETPAAESLLQTRLKDLDGRVRAPGEWTGKVVIVNFWATWCAPCREEIPLFVKLQSRYGSQGLQFIGIALDDPGKVRPFAQELGINYPILLGGIDTMDLMRRTGNGAGVLPYTVIFKRDGSIASSQVGAVKESFLTPLLALLLPG